MNARREDDIRIAERAAAWLAVLEGEPTPAQRAELMEWLEESPRHVREFLLMQTMDIEARGIDPEGRIDVDALLGSTDGNVVTLKEHAHAGGNAKVAPPHIWSSTARWAAGLAAVAVTFVIGWNFSDGFTTLGGERFATALGQQSSMVLEDGSVIELNAQSQLRVKFTENGRDIRLIDGEALFRVAPDARRPFRVRTGDTVVQAVGTEFNVRKREGGTHVAVIEGRVAIVADDDASTPHDGRRNELGAGEEARVLTGEKTTRRHVDVGEIAAWRRRQLIFREETLASIADEFNHYGRSPRIVVRGEEARSKRYGGIFHADDPESLVTFLSLDPALEIRRDAGDLIIRAREH